MTTKKKSSEKESAQKTRLAPLKPLKKNWAAVLSSSLFNLDTILNLVEEKLLLIENNFLLGQLKITCHYGTLNKDEKEGKEELKKFLHFIEREFHAFKLKNHLKDSINNTQLNNRNLAFTLNIPNRSHYEKFIHELNIPRLIPSHVNSKQEEGHAFDRQARHINPLNKKYRMPGA